MARLVNAERGEVALEINGVSLILCITLDGLAKYSRAIGARGLQDCFDRVQQAEPAALQAFVQACTIDGDAAALLSAMRTGSGGLQDLLALAAAASAAMAVFIDEGKPKKA